MGRGHGAGGMAQGAAAGGMAQGAGRRGQCAAYLTYDRW
jgi:hypothetical protein